MAKKTRTETLSMVLKMLQLRYTWLHFIRPFFSAHVYLCVCSFFSDGYFLFGAYSTFTLFVSHSVRFLFIVSARCCWRVVSVFVCLWIYVYCVMVVTVVVIVTHSLYKWDIWITKWHCHRNADTKTNRLSTFITHQTTTANEQGNLSTFHRHSHSNTPKLFGREETIFFRLRTI